MTSKAEDRKKIEFHRLMYPRSRNDIITFLWSNLNLKIPGRRICPNHDTPLDYLCDSFLPCPRPRDSVVWANRGGGKTQIGAVLSLLECLFMPGMRACILGGSREQSRLMYNYIRGYLDYKLAVAPADPPAAGGCRFVNGAEIEILTQSQKSVRGKHIQRLRCDEVELFDPEVWQAAQFVPQRRAGIASRLEIYSTLHEPFGLMSQIVAQSDAANRRVYRWCLWEVIEQCVGRTCSQCPLLEDCRRRARRADGYFAIDDAIAQKQRSSRAAWRSEMLCLEPRRQNVVFDEFDPAVHVVPLERNGTLPCYWGMDFGYSNPLAALLIQVPEGQTLVVDEYIQSRMRLSEHLRLLLERWPRPLELCCDPAGCQRNEITGTGPVEELAALGLAVRYRPTRVLEGVELIRRALRPAGGPARLLISPRCAGLIQALQSLRYGRLGGGAVSEQPHKDGVHDHVIDALRYFFVNHFAEGAQLKTARY